jgi:hypothetical protein
MVKFRTSICLFLLACSFSITGPVAASELNKKNGVVRISYDPLTLPGNEAMGLFGVSYLLDVGNWGYVGFTGFSAVTGQRGGFFTSGLQTGLRHRLNNRWLFDSGLFIGGGGGGAAPQGGGLMLRPHAGILYDFGSSRVGVGYSGVIYPNGSISSRQWYLSYEKPFSIFLADTSAGTVTVSPNNGSSALRLEPTEVTMVLRQYAPAAGSLDTSGLPLASTSHLFGASLRLYRGESMPRWFTSKEIAGSAGGDTDGYAEILAGIGYQSRLWSNKSFWESTLAIGAGGGGTVDTGGGLILRGELGAGYHFTPAFLARISAGYMSAPDGHYQASSLTAQLGYQWQFAGAHDYGTPIVPGETLETKHWRLRAVNQIYASPAWKGAPRGDTISLLGIKADMLLPSRTYLTGQGFGAYDGGAGGYAVGLLGIGKLFEVGEKDKFGASVELAVGAAGGGSVDVGSGVVVQPSVGITYSLGKNTSIDLNYSRIKALSGALDSSVYEIGMSYRFGTAGKSYKN